MMKNYDQSVEMNHNPNWPYISDHSYRISIIDGSGSRKLNVLFSLIKNKRSDIDKFIDMSKTIPIKVSIEF